MTKNKNGFTIVEILIVVVIIGILAAITIIAYRSIQVHSRDSQRASQAKIIATSLEAYYGKNGEYPGCNAVTQTGTTVSSLLNVDSGSLITPQSSTGTTNSIICGNLTSGNGDAFGYVGDGSSSCLTGSSCLQYTLQYRQESTGTVLSIQSRHQTSVVSSGAPTLTAQTTGNTQVNLSWTSISNATSYQLMWATDSGFTTNVVQANVSSLIYTASSLAPGTKYYFQVAAVASTGQGNWSSPATATTTISPPTATPSMSAAISGSNAVGTSSAVSCASGTVQYQLSYSSTNTSSAGSWSSWSAWGSSLTVSVAASQGYQYSFRSQAECLGGSIAATSAISNTATTVDPISAPAAPTYLSPASFQGNQTPAVVNYASYCPSGTSLTNAYFHSMAWDGSQWGPHPFGFNDSWQNVDGKDQNVQYWGTYQCQTYWTTSPLSPSSYNVIVVHYS